MNNITYFVRAHDYHVFETNRAGTKYRSHFDKNTYKKFILDDMLYHGHFIIDYEDILHYKKLNETYDKIIIKYKEKGIDYLSDGEREFIGL